MEYKIAKDIVVKLCYRLQPFCDKINIAGGIRRQKDNPHDIEVICLPKKEPIKDLFGDIIGLDTSNEFINTVQSFGKIIKGKATGKMMQIELPEKVMLDLFIPDDFDYYRQYAIRTGSADYSFKVIANGWKNIGWCGSDKGLRKIEDCEGTKTPDGKTKWKCLSDYAEKPPIWLDEKDFFKWIKVPYLSPKERK